MTDILELASLAEGAGFWNTLGFDLDHYSHRSFYWPIVSHLPSGACCVFGGDRLWPGPEPSFVLVLHVPLSWALFVKESGGKGGGAVTLLDCSTNTTGWCMRRVSSGKAAILQAISGLARQELCTICTHCMERERMVGRKRRRKMEGYSNRKIFACFSSIKTSETGFVLFRAANMYALFLYDNNLTCLTHAKT